MAADLARATALSHVVAEYLQMVKSQCEDQPLERGDKVDKAVRKQLHAVAHIRLPELGELKEEQINYVIDTVVFDYLDWAV